MHQWIERYISLQKAALDSINRDQVAKIIGLLENALRQDRQIFIFGNGGSASNASHFATDLGKGASDVLGRRFRVISLNDNVSWMTAISNDYSYEDVFRRQLENYATSGDLAFALSVSGNSPNLLRAIGWAKDHGLHTIALVGGRGGGLAEMADDVIVIDSQHYGRVEDVQMGICHMLCYVFIENATGDF